MIKPLQQKTDVESFTSYVEKLAAQVGTHGGRRFVDIGGKHSYSMNQIVMQLKKCIQAATENGNEKKQAELISKAVSLIGKMDNAEEFGQLKDPKTLREKYQKAMTSIRQWLGNHWNQMRHGNRDIESLKEAYPAHVSLRDQDTGKEGASSPSSNAPQPSKGVDAAKVSSKAKADVGNDTLFGRKISEIKSFKELDELLEGQTAGLMGDEKDSMLQKEFAKLSMDAVHMLFPIAQHHFLYTSLEQLGQFDLSFTEAQMKDRNHWSYIVGYHRPQRLERSKVVPMKIVHAHLPYMTYQDLRHLHLDQLRDLDFSQCDAKKIKDRLQDEKHFFRILVFDDRENRIPALSLNAVKMFYRYMDEEERGYLTPEQRKAIES